MTNGRPAVPKRSVPPIKDVNPNVAAQLSASAIVCSKKVPRALDEKVEPMAETSAQSRCSRSDQKRTTASTQANCDSRRCRLSATWPQSRLASCVEPARSVELATRRFGRPLDACGQRSPLAPGETRSRSSTSRTQDGAEACRGRGRGREFRLVNVASRPRLRAFKERAEHRSRPQASPSRATLTRSDARSSARRSRSQRLRPRTACTGTSVSSLLCPRLIAADRAPTPTPAPPGQVIAALLHHSASLAHSVAAKMSVEASTSAQSIHLAVVIHGACRGRCSPRSHGGATGYVYLSRSPQLT